MNTSRSTAFYGLLLALFAAVIALMLVVQNRQQVIYQGEATRDAERSTATQAADNADSTAVAVVQTSTAQAIANDIAVAQAVSNLEATRMVERENAAQFLFDQQRRADAAEADTQAYNTRLILLSAGQAREEGRTRYALSLLNHLLVTQPDNVEVYAPAAEAAYLPGLRWFVPDALPVYSVAYSPDGEHFASGTTHGQVTLWETGNDQPVFRLEFEDPDTLVSGVAYTPDGTQLAAVEFNGQISLWDTYTGRELRKWDSGLETGNGIAISPDGRWLAAGGGDFNAGLITLWDLESGELAHRLTDPDGSDLVFEVAFSPDSRMLAAGAAWHQGVDTWDVMTGDHLNSFVVPRGQNTFDVTFSPDGRHLAGALSGGQVFIWNAHTGGRLHQFNVTDDGQYIMSVAYSPDGRQIAAGDFGQRVTIWDAATRGLVQRLDNLTNTAIESVAYSADGQHLLIGSQWGEAGSLHVWDMTPAGTLNDIPSEGGFFTSAAFSPDGRLLVSGDDQGGVEVFDLMTSSVIAESTPHNGQVMVVRFSPDSQQFITGDFNGVMVVWNVNQLDNPSSLVAGGIINDAAISGDGNRLLSVSLGGTRLWSLAESRTIRTIGEADAQRVAFDPTNPDRVALAYMDGDVDILNLADGDQVIDTQRLTNGEFLLFIDAMTFSADGRYLAMLSPARGLIIWDTETGVVEERTPDQNERWQSLTAHPAEPIFAVGGGDYETGSVRVWHAAGGEFLRHISGLSANIQAVGFTPGQQLVMVGSNTVYYPNGRTEFIRDLRTTLFHTPTELTAWIAANRFLEPVECELLYPPCA